MLGGLVVWREELGHFSSEIVNLLKTFAAESVLAIQNARLFREIEEKSRELENLSRNIEQLYRLSTALQEPLRSPNSSRACSTPRATSSASIGSTSGHSPPRPTAWRLSPRPGSPSVTGRSWRRHNSRPRGGRDSSAACREGTPLLFTGETPLPPEYRLRPPYSALAGLRVKSFLVVPMSARGRPVGVLAADNRVSRAPIPPNTGGLLQTFAASPSSPSRTPGCSRSSRRRAASWRWPASTSRSSWRTCPTSCGRR